MTKIGTHNGTFHCDEVFACYLLKQLPQYKEAEIVRSRDLSQINNCDIVVDVGGIFNHIAHKYDHHQRSFNETFKTIRPDKPWDIKLSSAGLIYAYFGEQILKEMCKKYNSNIDINILYDKMYENFVMEIDAIDNGIPNFTGEPIYSISTSISSRVAHINPWWNKNKFNENDLFIKAINLVGSEFEDLLNYYINCWWPARDLVQEAIDKRLTIHKSGAILKLESGPCPWKSHFFDLEKNILGNGDGINSHQIKFVIYYHEKQWLVQYIPVSEKQCFTNRLSLLEHWRGLRDEELSNASGISNCIFVHSSGFMGGNKNFEGALRMAVQTIDVDELNTNY